jgi:SAM-dependent methyltransferase
LPDILNKHVKGSQAIDFGCGSGRSSRFLSNLGFEVIGLDNSAEMLEFAKEKDPNGNYQLVKDGEYDHLGLESYDLIQAIFTFDNIPDVDLRTQILGSLKKLLVNSGTFILLASTPEIYTNEWCSFSTKDFPENRKAKSGDLVQGIMTDVEDKRPVTDTIWFHHDYEKLFQAVDFNIASIYRPLGLENEPYDWISETRIPPWVIYVLKNPK